MNGREKGGGPPRDKKKTKAGPIGTAKKLGVPESNYPDDDGSSMGSYASDDDRDDGAPKTIEMQLSDSLDALLEKRASVRMSALEQLNNLMTFQYVGGVIEDKRETLIHSYLSCIRKGDAAEIVLACRGLQLMAITLGTSVIVESLFTSARPILETLIKDRARNSAAREAAISALSLLCFIASDNLDDANSLMSLFQDQYRAGTAPENIMARALEAWGLLASTYPTHMLGGQIINKNLPILTSLLEHKSLEVRTAAGEDIALLYSAYLELHAHDVTEEEKTLEDLTTPTPSNGVSFADTVRTPKLSARNPISTITPSIPSAASALHTPTPTTIPEHSTIEETGDMSPVSLSPTSISPRIIPTPIPITLSSRATTATPAPTSPSPPPSQLSVDYEDLVAALEALATDGSKHRARKDRAKQRSTFRDILHTVEDGDIPTEQLTLGKRKYEFSGWSKIKQLSIIRDVLGKGMLHHFMENELLSQIFDINIETEVDETEDRANRQANIAQSKSNQKDAYQRYTKQRRKKNSTFGRRIGRVE